MTPDDIKSIVQNELKNSQYNVAKIPYHTHNGTDSPPITLQAGVTELIAGSGIFISSSTGVITISSAPLPSTTIIRDSGTTYSGDSGNTVNASSHTCSGSDRLLIVLVHNGGGGAPTTITSVTYNGINMTQVSAQLNVFATANNLWLYYLRNPSLGTYDIVVTYDTSHAPTQIYGLSYVGVSQSLSFPDSSNSTSTGSSGTSVSVSTTTSRTNDWLVGAWMTNSATPTVGTGTTVAVGTVTLGILDSNGAVGVGSESLAMNVAGGSGAAMSILAISGVDSV